MTEIFLTVINMNISAGWIVLVVLLLRLLFKKAPKWIAVLLWGIAAVRLICPFTIESALSLIPSAQTISTEIMMDRTPEINSGVPIINSTLNPIITESFAPAPLASANPLQIWIPILSFVWLAGMVGMLLYATISSFQLKRKIETAILFRENVFQSESVVSPFVFGMIKPKIYLPFHMDEADMEHVVAHEQAHIRRKDHWWKPIGFLILTLHWFNPLIWLGYSMLCRDIELACDEKVIKPLNAEQKADYSQALLTCGVGRRRVAACPLAFGEVGVADRVKSVLHYKKPTFWAIAIALLACVVVAVCFLTDPTSNTIQKLARESGDMEDLRVYISDGEGHVWIHDVESERAQKFLQIKISQKEISLDRGEDRDKSYSVALQKYDGSKSQTHIYLNEDFTQVWVDDGVKPSLSYRIIRPEAAREAYRQMTQRQEPTVVPADGCETTVSYAGWSESVNMYEGALGDSRFALSSIQALPMRKFDTLKEFEAFKDTYGDLLPLDHGYDEVPSFLSATARYDGDFFKKNTLFVIYVSANNSTHRYALESIGYNSDSFYVHIKETTNAQATDTAMAGWFVTVAVSDEMIRTCTSFGADLT